MIELSNAYETLENCRYCLMCRHVAPVGHVTNQEALTPHGVALTIVSEQRGLIAWNDETIGIVYSEIDSGNSRAHCITDQPFGEAVARVRAYLVEEQFAPAIVYELADKLREGQSVYGAAPNPNSTSSEQSDVALFVGDEAHFLRPEMLDAVKKLLKAAGIEPLHVGAGHSSGFLAASLGLQEIARQHATAVIDMVQASGAKRLLVLSAGEYFTFCQAYNERLGIEWPNDIEVVEVINVLANAGITFEADQPNGAYAYIDPTHAVRVPTRHELPRGLLDASTGGQGKDLFWRRERAHPVGSTAIQFTRPALAEQLTRARLEDARNSGVQTLFCEDAATLHQLEQYASDYGLQVRGLYEWLADRLK